MNLEWKEKWVKALRSGQYSKGTECLRNSSGDTITYCCLGVLTDLVVQEFPDKYAWEKDGFVRLQDKEAGRITAVLPSPVLKLTGLDYSNPDIENPGKYKSYKRTLTLAELNDDTQITLAEIADLIEEQY